MNTPESTHEKRVLAALNHYHVASPLQLESFADLYDVDVAAQLHRLFINGDAEIHKDGQTPVEMIYSISTQGRDHARYNNT